MPAKTRHLQVRLDPEEYDAIKSRADAEGIRMQELGYRALMAYVEAPKDSEGAEPQFIARHRPLARTLAKLLAVANSRDVELLGEFLQMMARNAEGRRKAP